MLEIFVPDRAPAPRLHGELAAPAGEARLLAVALGPGDRQLQEARAGRPGPASIFRLLQAYWKMG